MAEEISEGLLELIQASIPTFQAAEALLFLAANRDRDFGVDEIVVGMRPRIIAAAAMKEYGALFASRRLVTETEGRFRYAPASSEMERRVCELSHAYNERPVTLIITIYHVARGTIQPLADSPKFRTD
jgi:hypothetical protein